LATVLSMVNFKGGVGKTTLSVNIAACLAQEFGQRVLLVDLDAQANASIWMLGPERWRSISGPDLNCTSYGLFFGNLSPDAIVVPYEGGGKNNPCMPQLHLIPSSFRMIVLENNIVERLHRQKSDGRYVLDSEYGYLHESIRPLHDRYDYIIYDCPPNIYYVTKNAMRSCRFIVMPCIPDTLSTFGLKLLVSRANHLITQLVRRKEVDVSAALLGVAVNKFKQVNELKRGLDELIATVEDMKSTGRYTIVKPQTTVFSYVVRDLIAHSEAVHAGKPLALHKPSSDAYKDIKALTAGIHSAVQEWA
jgi:chromosome partitioning protein